MADGFVNAARNPGELSPMANAGSQHQGEGVHHLTDTIVEDLAAHYGRDDLRSIVDGARSGNSSCCQKLFEMSIDVSMNAFEGAWHGVTTCADVRTAFTAELTALKRPRSRQASATSPRPALDAARDDRRTISGTSSTNEPRYLTWKHLADKCGFPSQALSSAEKELLAIIDRVLILGRGWGSKDAQRGKRISIRLQPSKLVDHGGKKSVRTYQRAIARLVDLRLIRVVATNGDGSREFVPTWWHAGGIDGAIEHLKLAAQRAIPPAFVSDSCRTSVAPLADSCRTSVAPPVKPMAPASLFICKRLGPVGVRHVSRRLTSYSEQQTYDGWCPTSFPARALSALPDARSCASRRSTPEGERK